MLTDIENNVFHKEEVTYWQRRMITNSAKLQCKYVFLLVMLSIWENTRIQQCAEQNFTQFYSPSRSKHDSFERD